MGNKPQTWSGARVAEEARLESVYTPKGYPEFESRSLRKREESILSFLYSVFLLRSNTPNILY